jgi:hypothetical protein
MGVSAYHVSLRKNGKRIRLSGGAQAVGKGTMKSKHLRKAGLALAGLLALAGIGKAQEKAQAVTQPVNPLNSYDATRENVLQGTVVVYTNSSTTPPLGAHVTVQTASGVVDVHIGNGKLLAANHMTLQAGDAVRITGETLAFGNSTIYAARLIQKGAQTISVRTTHGAPMMSLAPRGSVEQGGVR